MFGNIFGGAQQRAQQAGPSNQQQQAQQQQVGNQPPNANQTPGAANPQMQGMQGVQQTNQPLNANGSAPGYDVNSPAASQQGNQQGQQQDPTLDSFADLWQNVGNPGAGIEPLFNLDNARIGDAVKGLNFTNGMDPQLVQAALGGDQQAFSAVLNGAMQNVMQQMLQINTRMFNGAHEKQHSMFKGMIPDVITEQMATRDIYADMPALRHPAAQPVLNGLMSALRAKNPQASDADLKQSAISYFKTFANALNPQQQQAGQQQQPTEMNWDQWAQQDGQVPQGSINNLLSL